MPKAKQRQQKPSKANGGRARAPKRRTPRSALKRRNVPRRHRPGGSLPKWNGLNRSWRRRARRWQRWKRAPKSIRSPISPTDAASSASSSAPVPTSNATRPVLIYVDLDNFKRVNDQQGHVAGDAVLQAIAMVLTRHVRASDLAARVGGDEFALLLWHCSEADAEAKAFALEAAIARTAARHAGIAISVGASAGIAMLQPLDQPADVVGRADCAMYARKRARTAEAAE